MGLCKKAKSLLGAMIWFWTFYIPLNKDYGEKIVQRLNVIRQAKAFGFSLNEIADLLDMMDIQQANCSLLEEKVRVKMIDIDRKIEELRQMKRLIHSRLQEASMICKNESYNGNCAIISKE